MGLYGPTDNKDSNDIYGVLPYVAPEILQGNSQTKESDIYSFGIIMWTFSAGIRPWCNRPHNLSLATEICSGLRPEIIDGTPDVYIQLMKQCWNSDPLERPTASQINELLESWITAICDEPDQSEELRKKREILGVHGPVKKKNPNEIYGVLPYVAPEILKGSPATNLSDIYSFGIIMWTLSAGIRPWCNRPHDLKLAMEICSGLRPKTIDGAPDVYTQLMKQCWHCDPSKRPTASYLCELLGSWERTIELKYVPKFSSTGNF
ncbi:18223_t:CDS:2 [Funneliformis geosporum]|nr:18223_t:CDS:2 [Funneliformis geosporum]